MNDVKTIDIFSLFFNISQYEKGKDVNINVSVFPKIYDKTKDHLKFKYKQLWNDLQNGFFNYKELKFHLLYQYLIGKKPYITSIDRTKVKESYQRFSKEQWEKDKSTIKDICKRINKKNIQDFLEIKNNEEKYVAQELIERELISPLVYINYYDRLTNQLQDNDKFKRILKIIKQELNKN